MKNLTTFTFLTFTFFFVSCTIGQSQDGNTNLTATEFSQKINELPAAVVLDVRTPEEFLSGHLPNAKNIDWNGSDFDKLVTPLDKTKPVFVYCHSGRRSAAAASQLRKNGFTLVYELSGGIVEWMNSKLPITSEQ